MRKNKRRCDGCGKFRRYCDLLADSDELICVSCWGERCDAIERREAGAAVDAVPGVLERNEK